MGSTAGTVGSLQRDGIIRDMSHIKEQGFVTRVLREVRLDQPFKLIPSFFCEIHLLQLRG
jgi:hypothetical protein